MNARSLPRYRDLPLVDGGARSAWGLFGDEDSAGLMNLIGPAQIRDAAALVHRGVAFPLDLPIGTIDPPPFSRGASRHTVLERRAGVVFDDVHDNFFPQSGSQWDALAHIAYAPDRFYNGATARDIAEGKRDTIDHWASRGIVTRGVLLDVAESVAARGGAGESVPVRIEDLEAARKKAGIRYREGDILLLRTGFLSWYRQQDAATRLRQSRAELLTATGIGQSEQMVEYLWDAGIVAIATDTMGFECWPPDRSAAGFPFGFLHQVLLGQLGMAIGELWNLDELAADCAADGVFETLLISSPLNVPGGISSPPNAIAIK